MIEDPNNLKIDKAKEEDAEIAAYLMYLAFDDFVQYLFGTEDFKDIVHYFRKLWKKGKNRLSYEYSYIVRHNEKPVGLLTSCGGGFAEEMFLPTMLAIFKIDPGLLKYILLHLNYFYVLLKNPEALKDEYYVFMLAVLPEYQNKGIGTYLLNLAQQEAIKENYKKMSLLVKIGNLNAIKVYENFGFKKDKILNQKPMDFYKMVKELN